MPGSIQHRCRRPVVADVQADLDDTLALEVELLGEENLARGILQPGAYRREDCLAVPMDAQQFETVEIVELTDERVEALEVGEATMENSRAHGCRTTVWTSCNRSAP
jgi:hypothetical protein